MSDPCNQTTDVPRLYAIPEVAYPWRSWFALLPVKTIDKRWRWMRWVQKRRVWMVIWMTEYRDAT